MGIRSDINNNVPKLSVESLPCVLAKYLFQGSRAEYFQLAKNRSDPSELLSESDRIGLDSDSDRIRTPLFTTC